MEKKINNKIIAIIMFVAILAVYNIVLFLLVKEKNNVFWFNYVIFTLFYIFFAFSSVFLLSLRTTKVRFFGISLFSFSVYFFVAELFLSSILIAFSSKADIKWSVILQSLLLVIYIIIFCVSIMAMNYSHTVSEKYAKNVVDMRLVAFDVSKIVNKVDDQKVKAKLRELNDILKYSDPMGRDIVNDISEEIKMNIKQLDAEINSILPDDAVAMIEKIVTLSKERNEKLKISKM